MRRVETVRNNSRGRFVEKLDTDHSTDPGPGMMSGDTKLNTQNGFSSQSFLALWASVGHRGPPRRPRRGLAKPACVNPHRADSCNQATAANTSLSGALNNPRREVSYVDVARKPRDAPADAARSLSVSRCHAAPAERAAAALTQLGPSNGSATRRRPEEEGTREKAGRRRRPRARRDSPPR